MSIDLSCSCDDSGERTKAVATFTCTAWQVSEVAHILKVWLKLSLAREQL